MPKFSSKRNVVSNGEYSSMETKILVLTYFKILFKLQRFVLPASTP